jgi:saccharopine dehydrogenase-like NADP-dependent oxidoreductase
MSHNGHKQKILLIGAGRSSQYLIHYLTKHTEVGNWQLKIADLSFSEDFKNKVKAEEGVELIELDIKQEAARQNEVKAADLVISMLPAHMHLDVAKDCIAFKKHMVTASYISNEMKALEQEAIDAGVCMINEIGVDPGIDHCSAMEQIDHIRGAGGKLLDFETFTGGLVAPDSDDNPWNYKFSWNPRNVVIAGQGGAVKFIQEGTYKYIPYHKLFRRTELIEIEGHGRFEGYANRDSLKYRKVYGLEDIRTMYRGTLRRVGFCRAWDSFVQLGATDDSYVIENSAEITFRDFINLFLPYNPHDSVELKLRHYLNLAHDEVELFDKLAWLDIFKDIPVELERASPAQILQKILERKWKLEKGDHDMIVMWHKFVYEMDGKEHEKHSSMVLLGDDDFTAMSKSVGLPVALSARLILEGRIKESGIHVPIKKGMYQPILQALEEEGIRFEERQIS